MSSAAEKAICSPEQYLALERRAETKNEYLAGVIYGMTGASRAHNLIALNISRELSLQLKGRACEVYVSDLRVKVNATGLYTYPDVVVACGDIRFEDEHIDTLLNPTLIAEILSDSTEAYDRGEKFAHYRRLESPSEYVLVTQKRIRVERYVRTGKEWTLFEFNEPDETLRLDAIACELSLRDIYERVKFPENAALHSIDPNLRH